MIGNKQRVDTEAGAALITVSRRLRRSYEAGHSPKLLVLVDDTEDCGKAVYYSTHRRQGGSAASYRSLLWRAYVVGSGGGHAVRGAAGSSAIARTVRDSRQEILRPNCLRR